MSESLDRHIHATVGRDEVLCLLLLKFCYGRKEAERRKIHRDTTRKGRRRTRVGVKGERNDVRWNMEIERGGNDGD